MRFEQRFACKAGDLLDCHGVCPSPYFCSFDITVIQLASCVNAVFLWYFWRVSGSLEVRVLRFLESRDSNHGSRDPKFGADFGKWIWTCGGSVDFSIPSPEWRVAGATALCCCTHSMHSRNVALLIPPWISPGPCISDPILSFLRHPESLNRFPPQTFPHPVVHLSDTHNLIIFIRMYARSRSGSSRC